MIGDEDGMIQYDAYDQDNIARVYGYATTKEKAIEQCKLALKEYLQKQSEISISQRVLLIHISFYFVYCIMKILKLIFQQTRCLKYQMVIGV